MFRNPEVKRDLLLLGAGSLFFIVLANLWKGAEIATAVAVLCVIFTLFYLWRTWIRYRRIAALSEEIDHILHGETDRLLEHCEEGELAILAVQIRKMVRRMKEQQRNLQHEKVFLADAMADISHQMKTPLTSMQLILSFLQEENIAYAKRMEYVQKLTMLTERMSWMIYALLRMAKLDAGVIKLQRKPIAVEQLIAKSYESLAVAMDLQGVELETDIAPGAKTEGDSAWMREAITNILKNCMEHTPSGGTIRIEAEENALYVLIKVMDSGSGIAEKDLPHIFERFYRGTGGDSNNVGIGLALAKQIIQAQNGTIKAYNRSQQTGAVFEIRMYKSTI